MKRQRSATRLVLTTALLALLPSCTNGINAGKEGGIAFIGLAIMLVLTCVILWIVLGREQ